MGFDDLLADPFEDPFANLNPRSGSPDPWATFSHQLVTASDAHDLPYKFPYEYNKDGPSATLTTESYATGERSASSWNCLVDPLEVAGVNAEDGLSSPFGPTSPRTLGFRESISTPCRHMQTIAEPEPSTSPATLSPVPIAVPSTSTLVAAPAPPSLLSHSPKPLPPINPVTSLSASTSKLLSPIVSPLEWPMTLSSLNPSFACLALGGESPGGWNEAISSDASPYNANVPPGDAKAGKSKAGDAVSLEVQIGQRGAGFPRGTYFFIQEKGTNKCLSTYWWSKTEGVQIQLWPLQSRGNEKRCQLFYIDEAGALCHAMSGLAVDIIDDVPVLRRRHPIATCPNPWSHPLPIFTYEDFQIHVQFLSDPAITVCSRELYPNDSWKSRNHVLATRSEKKFHMHPISDFAPWIPRHMMGGISWDARANYNKAWKVLIEERSDGCDGDRILWEIIRAPNNS